MRLVSDFRGRGEKGDFAFARRSISLGVSEDVLVSSGGFDAEKRCVVEDCAWVRLGHSHWREINGLRHKDVFECGGVGRCDRSR